MAVQHHKIAYVTGSSRGIGEALVDLLIKEGYFVVGLARNNELQNDSYRFDQLDLSDLERVKSYSFEHATEKTVLVNNAGLIGEIAPLGELDNDMIENVMNVNTIALQILCNNFIKQFSSQDGEFQILNISSGAAKKPIESWATYCASKAAVDLFSETVSEELDWKQLENWKIHSCAPGVVDTQMQVEIRSSTTDSFKHVQNFQDYKENGDLYTPKHVASKLFEVIEKPQNFPQVVISVRDF